MIFDLSGDTVFGDTVPDIIDLPIEGERFRELTTEDQEVWIFFDEPIYFNDKIVGWLRTSRSISDIYDTLFNIRAVIFTATPIYGLLAILSSLFLTSSALTPIDTITKTANIIEKGDLSQRIITPKVNDEVGRLAKTFNKMIERIEYSFKKEKRFTSDASHELKTPISIISATAENALTKGNKTKDYKKAFKSIIDESKNVSFLISQLLFLARNDEGKESLNLEKIDLTLIAEGVINQLKDEAEKKDIKISINFGQDFKLKADQTLITILFLNIIKNSIKYSKNGGLINISLFKKDNGVKIYFEDNGIGISKEDLPYVFDRFYQVSKARTGKGSGIGLAIVKEITDLHNGKISISSKLGKGTRIEVLLPLN
ncbi:MAG: HAMP domain-containing histidine kinase [Actinobacteria bacterium]|nr:HAMP domain-containing histidine kinase [Actinomycetota bacterium]